MFRFAAQYRFLVLLPLICVIGLSAERTTAEDGSSEDVKAQNITFSVDQGEKVELQKYRIAWSDGMTIFDAMVQLKKQQKKFTFKHKGTGTTVFVTEINGIKNSGLSGDNWIYRVNKKLGDRGVGAYKLRPGDQVLWKFGKYR